MELTITRVACVAPPVFTGFIRDLTEQRRVERRRAAQYRLAEILAAAASLADAAPAMLAALTEAFEASFSSLWVVDGEVLRCASTHHAPPLIDDSFGALSRRMTFVRGIGVPGRIWQSGAPQWIEDVLQDDSVPRNETARTQGLHGAFGFPVRLGQAVVAVIELFSTHGLERDDDVVKLFDSLGYQIGQFLVRKQVEADRSQLLVQEHRARVEAEAANRAKDEFLAIVSHELRTPLNAILGWSTLLRSGGLSEEKRTRAIDAIERGARAQAQLIEDLLDVSRIVRRKLTLACAITDAAAVTRVAVDILQPSAQQRGVTIRTVGVGQPLSIWADRARLQQIVWNLVSNAVKFTPRGGTISVNLTRGEHHIAIVVQDTGMGIRPEFVPHLFERFRQGDQAVTPSQSGLGLGLAIVRHLVELHGGTITADSRGEGAGSTFTVRLPLGTHVT